MINTHTHTNKCAPKPIERPALLSGNFMMSRLTPTPAADAAEVVPVWEIAELLVDDGIIDVSSFTAALVACLPPGTGTYGLTMSHSVTDSTPSGGAEVVSIEAVANSWAVDASAFGADGGVVRASAPLPAMVLTMQYEGAGQ